MKKSFARLLMLCCILMPFLLKAQGSQSRLDSVQQKFAVSLAHQFKNYPHEKVFLHASQNVYLSGQTIWYQAYAMAYGKPSQLSKIVYVRLSDAQGKLIRQDKLPLNNSAAYGNIDLPRNLPGGWYSLQVFTAWMLNFDNRNIYGQPIYIQNAQQPIEAVSGTTPVPVKYRIDFFPEGGKLIDGTIAKVAFKAVDETGLPVSVSGQVFDPEGKPVAGLTTVHDGMGAFELETYSGTAYVARVQFPGNVVKDIPLPKVEKTGLSIRVNSAPADELEVAIADVGQQTDVSQILLEAVQDNGLAVSYRLQLNRGTNVFPFKKSDFSTGILRLAAFDQNGQLRAERAVFISPDTPPAISLTANTLSFMSGHENVFALNVRDSKGFPVKANLSISVTDARANTSEDNIGSYVLLDSETGNPVYHPGYYFRNNSDSLRRQLDLVMLTGNYGFLNWYNRLAGGKDIPRYAVEKAQFIAGKIDKFSPSQNLKIKMMIESADSGKIMAYVKPDSSGIFKLDNFAPSGDAAVYYEAVNAKNRKQPVDITFFRHRFDTVRLHTDTSKAPAFSRPAIDFAFLDSIADAENAFDIANGILLKPVNINQVKLARMELLLNAHVKRFDDDNAQNFDLVDEPTLPNEDIIDYITGKVPGLIIQRDPATGNVAMTYHGASELVKGTDGNPDKAFFYIDEVSADVDEVEHLQLTDVALIRFVPPPAWFAPLNGGFVGAITIYTKTQQDDRDTWNSRGSSRGAFDEYNFKGFSVSRDFEADAGNSTPSKQGLAYRTTLFWGHDMQPDENGNIKLRFKAAGQAKKYRVVVQGMDNNGRLIYFEKVF